VGRHPPLTGHRCPTIDGAHATKSGPKTARNGNLLGAAAAVVACLMPFFWTDLHLQHIPLIIIAIAIGTVIGVYGARTVQMTQMPQMVALFNGVGGGAVALVSLSEFHDRIPATGDIALDTLIPTVLACIIGAVSFAGSKEDKKQSSSKPAVTEPKRAAE